MAVESLASRQARATADAAGRTYACAFTANPNNTTGSNANEVTGGSYVRVVFADSSVDSNALITGSAALVIPAGVTVAYVGEATSSSGATVAYSDAIGTPYTGPGTLTVTRRVQG